MIRLRRAFECSHPQAFWLTLLMQIPALRSLLKHAPYPLLSSAVLFFAVYVFFCLLLAALEKKWVLLNSCLVGAGCLFLITAVGVTVYPRLDAYEKSIGHDSTADDAMIVTARALFAGAPMYSAHLYNDAPISPGPGWILSNMLFSVPDAWAWAAPCYLAVMAWCVSRLYGWGIANAMLLTFMSSLNFWSLLVNGHDLLPLGVMILMLSLLVLRCSNKNSVLLVLLLGVAATARIVLMALPVLAGLFLWKRRGRVALWVPLAGFLLAMGLHLWAAHAVAVYPPLHLFQRADRNIGLPLMVMGAIATAAMGWMTLLRYRGDDNNFWFYLSLCLIVPFGFMSLGELAGLHWAVTAWEGASDVWPALPVCVLALLLNAQKDTLPRSA